MDCIKCGAALPENALYCPSCGKKQRTVERKRTKRANGLGTVYKLPGKRTLPWAARKDREYIGCFPTRTAALEALNKLSGHTIRDNYNFTFADVYAHWSQEHYRDLGASGVEQYKTAYAVFAPLHDRKFRDLRASDFQQILDTQQDKSVSTVGKYKQLITQMSDWAIREEIVSTNFAHYTKAKGRPVKSHVPMTQEDIRLLTEAAETDETAKIVCMLLATGMRIGELFALRIEDCYGAYVIGGEKSEAGRGRVIPIRPEGRPHFDYFAHHSFGAELLLDSYVGNHDVKNFRRRDYYDLLDRLGISREKTPHSTRTTYTTRAVQEKLAPADLQKVLGHADFDTTQRYYNKPSADMLVKAVESSLAKEDPPPDNAAV